METLKKLYEFVAIIATIIALFGALSTGSVVFIVSSLLALPAIAKRIYDASKPWSSKK